jgi:hypothetical protein
MRLMDAEGWKYEALANAEALRQQDDLISEIRDLLWKTEADLKKAVASVLTWQDRWRGDRDLADRLAEALRSRLAFGYLPGDERANAAFAAWEEARKLDP